MINFKNLTKITFLIFTSAFIISCNRFAHNDSKYEHDKKILTEYINSYNQSPDTLKKLASDFEAYLKQNEDNQEAHYFLGYTYDKIALTDGCNFPVVDIDLELKALAEFRTVIKIDPVYENDILILSPYSKITGINATIAEYYALKNNIDSVKFYLKRAKDQGGLLPYAEALAINTMSSCEKDAILFVSGDDILFPIWYVQIIEGYRKDITVVDMELLNCSWYSKQLKNSYLFGNNNLKINMLDTEMDNIEPLLHSKSFDTLYVPDELLKKSDINNEFILKNKFITWKMVPSFKGQYPTQDFMLLKILKDNKWQRPVYFNINIPRHYCVGLDDYLHITGLTLELTPVDINYAGFINEPVTRKNLLSDHSESEFQTGFIWDWLKDETTEFAKNTVYGPIQFYIMVYLTFADFCAKYKDKIEVLEKLNNLIPKSRFEWDKNLIKYEKDIKNKIK